MLRAAPRNGLIAGLLATTLLVGLLYLLSAFRWLSFVPYDLADLIIRLTPGQIATEGIEALGVVAKITIKLVSIALVIGFGGVLGGIVGWLVERRGEQRIGGTSNSAALVLFLALLGLALANQSATQTSPLLPVPFLIRLFAAFGWGALLAYLYRGLARPQIHDESAPEAQHERRAFLVKSGAAVVTLAIGSTALAELFAAAPDTPPDQVALLPGSNPNPTPVPDSLGNFQAPADVRSRITSQRDLYYVSSRTRDPRVDPQTYTLRIEGNVERPLELTLEQLQRLPRVDQTSTLECISNEVGGNLIGNCTWNGTRLADLLQQAGLRAESRRVALYGADGYVDSIDLADALKPTTLVVLGIDSQPLTVPHGYPARLIVPNIYGMKNVKWLQRIEVVTFDFQGYWQERGWSNPAVVQTTSVVDTAGGISLENGVVPLGGIAFAGSRGIQRVEVRIDEGEWSAATLEPAESPIQWRRWRWDWPATPGRHMVTVRAMDGAGELQTEGIADPHPDGATGYHSVRVDVRG
ncbi:MAG TPA: molybdopterin-dependent oxidoreductase [Herpetosiphonaceae bacterium]